MKVGVNLITFGPGASEDALARWAGFAETVGYHFMMLGDHVTITPDVQGRYPEARELYDKALALDPGSYDVHHNIGDALLAQGDYEQAGASYRRSLELNPAFASARHNLGLTHLHRQDFVQGWPGYERRIDTPDDVAKTAREQAPGGDTASWWLRQALHSGGPLPGDRP